jgi:hypothetical protein
MVRAYILADPAITAQIGTRLYPIKLPQAPTFPAMTMQRISNFPASSLRGRASLARPRYQFDVWTKEGTSSAFSSTQTIGNLLRARLEAANVDLLDESVSPAEYRRFAFDFDTDRDLYETDVNGGYFRYSADYLIWHQTGEGPTT